MLKNILLIVGLSLYAIFCLANTQDTEILKAKLKGPVVGGHQGSLYTFKPNTIEAFQEAYDDKVTIVEMDLHLTKDGVAVVYHDDSLTGSTTCFGPIHNKTLKELQQCAFLWRRDVRIPTFESVLQWSHGKIVINAEFKQREVIPEAVRLAKKYHCYQWCYFQTQGDKAKYAMARALGPEVPLLFSPKNDADIKWVLNVIDDNLIIVELDPRFDHLDLPSLIESIHSERRLVSVDSFDYSYSREILGAQCTKVFEMGIDIAITNRPADCVKQRDNFHK